MYDIYVDVIRAELCVVVVVIIIAVVVMVVIIMVLVLVLVVVFVVLVVIVAFIGNDAQNEADKITAFALCNSFGKCSC